MTTNEMPCDEYADMMEAAIDDAKRAGDHELAKAITERLNAFFEAEIASGRVYMISADLEKPKVTMQ